MTAEILASIPAALASYEACRERAVAFILAQVGDDGAITCAAGPRVTFYRVPWALAVSGETAAGSRVLGWVEAAAMDADGHFHGGLALTSDANATTAGYAETCLAYGATLLRRFDLARRAMAYAERFVDPATGGTFMDPDRTGADDPQLLFLTCQYGNSAIMTGNLPGALRAADWLERLWAAQPDLPNRLFTIWTRAGGLATTVPPDGDPRQYIDVAQEERQYHYNGGIAASFLGHLHLATGDPRWLELGKNYQRYSMESTEEQFKTRQVCKSAWGAGLLSLATSDPIYLPWLLKMGDWFVGLQLADGSWTNTPYLDPDPPVERRLEVAAEFVIHLDTVIGSLSTALATAGHPRAAAATTGRVSYP